jgi:hypothetical protein
MISRCFSENGAELLDLLMTSSCCDILVPGRAAHIGSPNPLLSYQAVEDVFRLAGTKLQLDILSWHGHDSSWVRDGPNLVGATAECNAAPAPGHSHRVTGSRHRRRRQRGRRGCVSQQNGRGVAAMSWRPDPTRRALASRFLRYRVSGSYLAHPAWLTIHDGGIRSGLRAYASA